MPERLLENDNFTLSLACDAYTQGEVNALLAPLASESWALATLGSYYTSSETNGAIAAALTAYYDSAQTDAAIAAALVPYSTTAQMDTAIAAAVGAIDLSGYSTIAARDAALAVALVPYSTTMQMDAAIAAAVGAIDLSGYSTITARDAAIAAALVPYSTTVQMDAAIAAALGDYVPWTGLQAPIINEINIALTDYWDQTETSAEIASQISGAGLLTEAQGDARYHPVNGNAGGGGIIPMVLDNFTPRMIRALLPQAPLRANLILGNSATVQLTCDCYSKTESDGRYFSNTDYAPLDSRYHVVNGNAGGGRHYPNGPRQLYAKDDPGAAAPGTPRGEPDPGQLRHGAADLRLLQHSRYATRERGRLPARGRRAGGHPVPGQRRSRHR